jgi:asparagine synthase (glutamine-hydrolysing)
VLPAELRPTPLELAASVVVGWDPPDPLPAVPPALTPLDALEEALVPALDRGGCLVAFSGGRDSSTMLTVATRAARRRGFADPIPVTLRFPGAEGTDERDWQEDVVAHLGLSDWRRIELTDELDLLGDVARDVLLRHRCPWPANGHSFEPLYAAARGGTLVTGMDGDGLLDGWQWAHTAALLARRRRPVPRDVLRLAKAYGPRALRRAATVRRERPFAALDWLTDEARQSITRLWADYVGGEPARWDRRLRWYPGQRYLRALAALMEANAAHHGAAVLHPLLDRRFLAAVARAGGRAGFANRTEALRALTGALLPERTITRRSKADFTWAFWGPESRRFAETWDGTGLDPSLVRAHRLRAAWLAPKPDFRSASLLQTAWLASRGLDG